MQPAEFDGIRFGNPVAAAVGTYITLSITYDQIDHKRVEGAGDPTG